MLPTVRAGSGSDKRKGKSVQWQEARLSLAHVQGSQEKVYAASLQGEVQAVGKQLWACAKRVGFDARQRLHGVGDGATWIAQQVAKRFGSRGRYLLDFYHVCDYLAPAAQAIQAQPAAQQAWLHAQQARPKTNAVGAVLRALFEHVEAPDIPEEQAPVRKCWRYLSQRSNQLDYAGAIEQGLPIGSGEIESAHRYITQKRLKLAGTWWNETNAEHMLALRVCRANGEWISYWSTNYLWAQAA